MEQIELATLLPGALPRSEATAEMVWHGDIQTNAGSVSAYIKLLEPHKMISEIVCSLLGRHIGLKIPQPYLVSGNTSQLGVDNHSQDVLMFGSRDADSVQFYDIVNRDAEYAEQLLMKWKDYKDVAFFDEWIANIDRHAGNILYNGRSGFWLIDHSHALTGGEWHLFGLNDATGTHDNKLLDPIAEELTEHVRYQWRKYVIDLVDKKYDKTPVSSLEENGYLKNVADDIDIQQVLKFVSDRVPHVVSLVCKKLGLPELKL